jgi:hypothetical protein
MAVTGRPDITRSSAPVRALVLLLTALTGFAGLAYEVAWQRYLAALLGAQSEATAAVLAIFLGGLSVGYWLFGAVTRELVARSQAAGRPPPLLAYYGAVEAFIGVYALLFPVALSRAQQISLCFRPAAVSSRSRRRRARRGADRPARGADGRNDPDPDPGARAQPRRRAARARARLREQHRGRVRGRARGRVLARALARPRRRRASDGRDQSRRWRGIRVARLRASAVVALEAPAGPARRFGCGALRRRGALDRLRRR